jgi:hypothetical protein
MENITASGARKIATAFLSSHSIVPRSMKAKTVSFMDLGRGSRVFLDLRADLSRDQWVELHAIAKQSGFSIG